MLEKKAKSRLRRRFSSRDAGSDGNFRAGTGSDGNFRAGTRAQTTIFEPGRAQTAIFEPGRGLRRRFSSWDGLSQRFSSLGRPQMASRLFSSLGRAQTASDGVMAKFKLRATSDMASEAIFELRDVKYFRKKSFEVLLVLIFRLQGQGDRVLYCRLPILPIHYYFSSRPTSPIYY